MSWMPLARPYSSKPSSRQTYPYLTGISATQVHGGSFQRWRRAGRGRGTEQEPLSVMQCKFQPRACIAARSLLLEGRSGSSLSSRTALLAFRSRNSQYQCRLAAATPIPFGRRERDAESTLVSEQPARFSPFHVFPRVVCSYRKGNSCS